MSDQEKFILKVLHIVYKYDDCDILKWSVENNKVYFYVNCNDLFWWATADGESVTEENVDEFERAYIDTNAINPDRGSIYASALFCCRVRKMRPQGVAYPKEAKELWPLFDACGPERPIDKEPFGNPRPRPS
jgi:hypothetical protein